MIADRGHARIFSSAAQLRPKDGERLVAALAMLAGFHRPGRRSAPGGSFRVELAAVATRAADTLGVAPRAGREHNGRSGELVCSMPRSAALDLAAELLEIADRMHAAGHLLEAFALEGIEGLLLEALVAPGS